MSIQSLQEQSELLSAWSDFTIKKSSFDDSSSQLRETILVLEANELYNTTASNEEKALVAEYKTKLGIV